MKLLRYERKRTRVSLSLEILEDRVVLNSDFYTIDGTGNNEENPEVGSTDTQLIRLVTEDYADGISEPAGEDRPSTREISNIVVDQDESITNDRYLTDLTWLFGQFIDHDLDLTEGADPAEPFNISVPAGDEYFDPFNTGTQEISLNRSAYDTETGETDARQQINEITAWLDGSVIYGSDEERANALRTGVNGLLEVSAGDLLPFNDEGLANANIGLPEESLFLAGDVRANENAALTAMHTVWVREHNYWAEQIFADDPTLTDDEIYEQARAIGIAELQAITYNEFLPALLGEGAIKPYSGYDPDVDPSIANIFSTASYRFGHSMLSSELLRLNNDGTVIEEGNLPLQEAFFAPDEILDNGIDSILLGAATQKAQEIDPFIVDDVRNFLFGPPGAGGFDLASLNIQRGRDHGLPSYNEARVELGLDPVESFADISSDLEIQARLEEAYGTVDNIDLWVGALAEDHVHDASMGELNYTVLVDQFTRIRDGDRFWYENIYEGEQLEQFQNTTLADVLERNTDLELRDNVFFSESVLYYKGDTGESVDVTLNSDNGTIQVVDNESGEILTSGSADTIEQVQIVGQNRIDDRFTVELTPAINDLEGGVNVHGGERDRDLLVVQGTPQNDQFTLSRNEVQANGLTIVHSAFNRLHIQAGLGDDTIQVLRKYRLQTLVQGGEGDDTLIGGNKNTRFEGGPGQDQVVDRSDNGPSGGPGDHRGHHHSPGWEPQGPGPQGRPSDNGPTGLQNQGPQNQGSNGDQQQAIGALDFIFSQQRNRSRRG